MHMVRHYAILIHLDDGEIFRKVFNGLLDYFAENRTLDIGAARVAGSNPGIALYLSVSLAAIRFA